MGITPMPIMVETMGMPLFRAKAAISSLAFESTTPPPQQMTGRFASRMAWAAFRICLGWPLVLGRYPSISARSG